MFIKRGNGKITSIIKSEELSDQEKEEVKQAALIDFGKKEEKADDMKKPGEKAE